jgi:hypothetical protein
MADNLRVWDGQKRGHYEVWYLTCNHLASRTGFWIRYTLEAPLAGHGEPYAQLWFAVFDHDMPARSFAINKKFSAAVMRAETSPFSLSIDKGNVLTHDSAIGSLAGDGHVARWNLSWLPGERTYRQLPAASYRGTWADTKVCTPNLDVPIRGTIEIDGGVLSFDGDPGGQTHLYGRKHAHAWAWGHCNAFEGHRGAALEALSVKLKRRGMVLPPLTVFGLQLDGEELRWGEFHQVPFSRGAFGTGFFRFSGVSPGARVEGEYTCRPEDLTIAEYADPDGEASFCANTEVADLRVTVWRRTAISLSRFREAARLYAPGTGHFEVAGRAPDLAVTRRHVSV